MDKDLGTFGNGLVTETQDEFPVPDYAPAMQLVCMKCGGKEFHVGSGDYLTAVRCVKCLIPCRVHEG
jgi:hypothetical protein